MWVLCRKFKTVFASASARFSPLNLRCWLLLNSVCTSQLGKYFLIIRDFCMILEEHTSYLHENYIKFQIEDYFHPYLLAIDCSYIIIYVNCLLLQTIRKIYYLHHFHLFIATNGKKSSIFSKTKIF